MNKNKKLEIDETFNSAVKNHQENKTDIAEDLYNQVLKIDPNHANAHNNLGVIYQNSGEAEKAKKCYEKAIEINSNYANAHNNLGVMFANLSELQKAKNCFEKAVVINPSYVEAHNNLGAIYKNLGETEKAKNCFEKAIEINPNYADAHSNLGAIFNDLGETEKAKNCFEKAIEINPGYADAHSNLGAIFNNLGETEKAKNCFEKAIEINPGYANAYYNLGVILANLGENQKARDCYEKVIEINPNHPGTYNNLGAIFNSLGEVKKAKECYEKAIEIDPDHADALNNLGVIYRELVEIQKARDCYEKAIKINPNHTFALNNLGITFQDLEENQKARDCYEKAIKINPNHTDALNNLGITFQDLGENEKAMNCFEKLIKINSTDIPTIVNMAKFFNKLNFNISSKEQIQLYKGLYLFLFRNNSIEHIGLTNNVRLLLFSQFNETQIQQIITSKTSLLTNDFIQDLLKEELLYLVLQKSLIPDKFIEKFLTALRYEILSTLNNSNKDTLNKNFNFIISLAEQCWLNEFIYIESENEIKHINQLQEKIENEKKINELDIAILGCYIPLCTSKIISEKLLNYESSNILFNDLINVQIKEPLREKELTKSIASLGEINDSISKKVQEQYEEHPYPRWRYTNKYTQSHVSLIINEEIKPNKIKYNEKFNNPNILVAGCGTGSHPISTTRYKNSNILAVDLSLTSLAYAKRKTEEFGIKNVEYMHADLLQLKKLNKKFDIIESAGVLHHMKDPIAGLKVLTHMLEPHGFMKLGLYSELARKSVVKGRDFIKKNNFNNTTDDIKIFRQLLINKKEDLLLREIVRSTDFYSTSRVRDLLFHVQEHRFTIPQISKMLKDLDLEFLGFLYPNQAIKIEYSKLFPNDKKCTSLDNWHKFEEKNPNTFWAMYQFWIRKYK